MIWFRAFNWLGVCGCVCMGEWDIVRGKWVRLYEVGEGWIGESRGVGWDGVYIVGGCRWW